jgi:hypothetical protein
MKSRIIDLIYYISGIILVLAMANHRLVIFEELPNEAIIAFSIVVPFLVDYDALVRKGFLNLWIRLVIILSGVILLINFQLGLFIFLISSSALFAKRRGWIFGS